MDVLVLGGGCLGLSAALALAEQGDDVVLAERDRCGAGATGRAAGVLSTMTWHDDEYALIAETRGRIGELISLAMIEGDPSARQVWKPVDSILVAGGDNMARLDEVQALLERNTEEPERLDHRTAAREYPGLSFAPGEEVLVAQEDGVIEAGDLVQVLRGRCEAEGVEVREGQAPEWQVTDHAVDAPGFDAVLVAAGAWTRPLVEQATGVRLHLGAFRTQAASIRMPRADEVPIVHDLVHGWYARPDSEGAFLAGNGTRLERHDPDHHDAAADTAFRDATAERVVQRMARGGEAAWHRGWAGLCTGTPDRRPLVGPVPGIEGLHVLGGDNGFGLMRSIALGERAADALRGRVDPALDPARFADVDPDTFPLREGYG